MAGTVGWDRAPGAAPAQPGLCLQPFRAGSRGQGRLWLCWELHVWLWASGTWWGSFSHGAGSLGVLSFPRGRDTSSPVLSLERAPCVCVCVPSDQPGQFSQFQSMGNRNAVLCVQREPFPLPRSGWSWEGLTAPWLLHSDSAGSSALYTPPVTPCVPMGPRAGSPVSLGVPPLSWPLMTLAGSIFQWGTSSALEQAGAGTKGATASPGGW